MEVLVSDRFQAIFGRLVGKGWTTPRLVEMVITPDGHLFGRCDGQERAVFLGASEDLSRNIHGFASSPISTEIVGFLVAKMGEIERRP